MTTTAPGGSGSAPTQTPASTAATSASTRPGQHEPPAGGAGAAPPVRVSERVPPAVVVIGSAVLSPAASSATDSAKSATRGPQREAMSSSASRTRPSWTAGTVSNAGRWATVSAVCSQHLVSASTIRSGRLADDVLGGQLRVAAGGVGRAVGDVLQAEERVDAADERAAVRGEEARVELVVDPHALDVVRDGRDRGLDPVLHVGDDLVGLVGVAGGVAEGLELSVAVVEVGRGAEQQRGHLEGVERVDDAVQVVAEDHEVGLVAAIASAFGVNADRSVIGASSG